MYEVLFEIENVTNDMSIEEIEEKIKQETSIISGSVVLKQK